MNYLTPIPPDLKHTLESQPPQDQCLVHRYLYYVLASPLLTDRDYDMLERDGTQALDDLEENLSTCVVNPHPLMRPGSDIGSTYSQETADLALLIHNRILH